MMLTVPLSFVLREPVFPTRLQGTPCPMQPCHDLKTKLSHHPCCSSEIRVPQAQQGLDRCWLWKVGLRSSPRSCFPGSPTCSLKVGTLRSGTWVTQSQASVQDNSQQRLPPIRKMESKRIDIICCPSGYNPTAESSRNKLSNDL